MIKLKYQNHSIQRMFGAFSLLLFVHVSLYSQTTKFDINLFSTPEGFENTELKSGSIDTIFAKQKTVMLNSAVSMGQIHVGNSIGFDLFGEQFGSRVDKIEANINGTTTIRSRLVDYPMGFMLISTTNGLSSGVIHIPELGQQYSFTTKDPSGLAIIGLINSSTLYGNQPRCAIETDGNSFPTDFVQLKSSEFGLKNQVESLSDSIVTIDIMVVYTQRILADYLAEGIEILNSISNQIAYMNMVMENSKTFTRFNLVYSGCTDYSFNPNTQSNYMDALVRFQNKNDGYMDEIHELRDTYHADIVVLVAEIMGVGGVSTGLSRKGGDSELNAQIVCAQQFKNDISLMMHEAGHNFGCDHNRYQRTNAGPNSWIDWPENTWSAGWYWTGEDKMDYCCVMSYGDSNDGKMYSVTPYFSNPTVLHKNVATGDPVLADNARTLREMRGVISKYRKNTYDNCIVSTRIVTLLSESTATCGGEVLSVGSSSVTERGVCWSTKINPTINDNKTLNGSGLGHFLSSLTGLLSSTEYYIRAYATNSSGTRYGPLQVFKTGDNYVFDSSTGILSISGSVSEVLPSKVIAALSKTGASANSLKKVIFNGITGKIVIANDAFKGYNELTSVILPDSLTAIGHWAFSGCSNLESIIIPQTVKTIDDEAFQSCTNLSKLNIPSSTVSIGNRFIEGCSNLKTIDVSPNNSNYKSMDGVLFDKSGKTLISFPNANSSNYSVPNGVTTIGEFAFFTRTGLTSINLPSSISTIKHAAFWSTNNLVSFNVDSSNPSYKTVDGVLFSKDGTKLVYYPNAKGKSYNIPSGAKIIGAGAFADCSNLNTISFPLSVTNIEDYAFRCCYGLKSIYLTSSVTDIGYYSFGECRELELITFPQTIRSIGGSAFFLCEKLNYVTCLSTTEPTINNMAFYGTPAKMLFVPNASQGFTAYKWGVGVTIIYGSFAENSVTFDSQGGSSIDQFVVRYNESINAPKDPVKKGYVFDGWYKETGYINRWNFSVDLVTKSITLYAKWSVLVYNINETKTICTGQDYQGWTTSGTYKRNLVSKDGNDSIVTTNLTVNTLPSSAIQISGPQKVTIGQKQITYSILPIPNAKSYVWDLPNGIVGSSVNTSIAVEVGNLAVSGDIKVQVVNDCGAGPALNYFITVNHVPVANANIDQTINEGVLVSLDGSLSSDPDGTTLTYQWTAPAGIILSSNTIAKPTFTAPEVTQDTPYTFSLVVSDGTASSTVDQVVITVKNVNKVPVANAGPDQTVNEGIAINLDGSTSTDPDGTALTYQWTAPIGISLSSNTIAKPSFTAPEVTQDTPYTFSLVVSDGTASSTFDQVVIIVKNVNKVPIANAGPDQTVNEGIAINLDGSTSTDPDGTALTYQWTAPTGITLSSTTIAKPSFTAPEVTQDTPYTFSLVVSDGTASSTIDQVVITVKNINKIPIANAGPDQTVNEGIAINLDGSTSTDPDGTALTYQWTAPSGIILNSNTIAKPSFTAPEVIQDTPYSFSLVVSDGTATSTVDQVVITVKNVNKIPIANAGPDQTVNEGIAINLDGSASTDPDGTALTYQWTAPIGISLSSNTIAKPNFTAPEVTQDTPYTFSLVVSDGTASSTVDRVVITVKNVNKVPIANAGPEQTVKEGSMVMLNGSASSDPDNDPLVFKWISPKDIVLNNSTVSKPIFTAPEVKRDTTYTISLVINDGKIDSPSSTIKIYVLNVVKVSANITETPKFKVYPNPTTGEIFIELAGQNFEASEVTLLNSVGAVVLKKQITDQEPVKLDLSNLLNGMYLIKLKDADKSFFNKILLQK